MPNDFPNTILEALERAIQKARLRQFIVRALPYTRQEALGDRQKALAVSSKNVASSSKSHNSSAVADNGDGLPAVDCVILNEQTINLDDRYSANFKGLNYPCQLLRYHVLQTRLAALASGDSLIDNPPVFSSVNFSTFRFVRCGEPDTTAQRKPLTLKNQPNGATKSIIEKLKGSLNGQLLLSLRHAYLSHCRMPFGAGQGVS